MRQPQRCIETMLIVPLAVALLTGCHHGGSQSNIAPPTASEVTEFDSAVRDGDTTIISQLLTAKPDMINARDENGKTPLTIANEKSDTDMVALLKKHGGHD